MTTTSDDWMTVDELAEWLKITKEWVYDRVQANAIPHHRLGRQLRFRLTEIEAYLARVASGPADASADAEHDAVPA